MRDFNKHSDFSKYIIRHFYASPSMLIISLPLLKGNATEALLPKGDGLGLENKFNIRPSSQFHLWWYQVCGTWNVYIKIQFTSLRK